MSTRRIHFTSQVHLVKTKLYLGTWTACGVLFQNRESAYFPHAPLSSITCKNCKRSLGYFYYLSNRLPKVRIIGKGYEVK